MKVYLNFINQDNSIKILSLEILFLKTKFYFLYCTKKQVYD